MYTPWYSPEELAQALLSLNSGVPLKELAKLLDRSAYGIALKMRMLSRRDAATWDPEKVAEYTRREIKRHKGDLLGQKRRWHARQRGDIPPYAKPRRRRKPRHSLSLDGRGSG